MQTVGAASLRLLVVTLGCLLATTSVRGDTGPSRARLDKKIANIPFTDANGKPASLYDLRDKKAIVLVFLSFDCPMSNGYAPILNDLVKAYTKRGVEVVGVCANDEEPAQIAKSIRELQIAFPVFKDNKFTAANALEADVTPEAFILDGNYVLRYRGRIDDEYAARLKKNARITRNDLRVALDELLAGKSISEPATQAFGCPIFRSAEVRKPGGDVTFYRDVLPILQNNCQTCHRPGEVGPFSLMSYRQAINWASDIKDFTQSRRMPPWKPVEGDEFRDQRKLSDREIAILAAWADGGTPEGDPKDAPEPRKFVDGWQLGEPDLILTVPNDFQVGASGRDVFRCFVLPTNLTEDKYVTAVEVRPSNRRVVHHTLNFIDTTGQARKLEQAAQAKAQATDVDIGPGYSVTMGVGFLPRAGMGGWAPGQVARYLPPGSGYLLPKGADVVLQVHYHRNGRVEKDRISLGLHFAKKPIERPFQGTVIPGRFLFIPAGTERFAVKGSIWIDQDCKLYSVMPHMHMLGREIKVTLTPPDGPARTLVAIKDWDYNWQETYFLTRPIVVKAGTRFDVEAVYDNSSKNPNNPNNPPQAVRFGEQTTDEMCFVFLGATSDQPGRIRVLRTAPQEKK
jgi:peroxiredoxin